MLSSIISEISNFKAYFVAPLFAAIIIVKLKFQRELSSRKKKKIGTREIMTITCYKIAIIFSHIKWQLLPLLFIIQVWLNVHLLKHVQTCSFAKHVYLFVYLFIKRNLTFIYHLNLNVCKGNLKTINHKNQSFRVTLSCVKWNYSERGPRRH